MFGGGRRRRRSESAAGPEVGTRNRARHVSPPFGDHACARKLHPSGVEPDDDMMTRTVSWGSGCGGFVISLLASTALLLGCAETLDCSVGLGVRDLSASLDRPCSLCVAFSEEIVVSTILARG